MIFTVQDHEDAYKIVYTNEPKENKTPIAIVKKRENAIRIARLLNDNERIAYLKSNGDIEVHYKKSDPYPIPRFKNGSSVYADKR